MYAVHCTTSQQSDMLYKVGTEKVDQWIKYTIIIILLYYYRGIYVL